MSSLSATPARVQVDTRRFLSLTTKPERLREQLDIAVSEHAFLPQIEDLQTDWVASVATPAFKLIRQRQGVQPAFCSIGTGTGMDALAAIETLGAYRVGITDVHDDVVSTAEQNIANNLLSPGSVIIQSGSGDLLSPLSHLQPRYDLIYENLPNVPIQDAGLMDKARVSSSHVPPRTELIPAYIQEQMLTLHYLALKQSRDFLNPGGAVLSMLGARVPLAVFIEMAKLAGHKGEIYTYTWKNQTDAETIIENYIQKQREGLGPFHFYRADRLAKAFERVDLATSGLRAFELEAFLFADRLSPEQTREAFRRGGKIGHTVAVLRSQPA
jgi:methylase of polypeptide subunit release factors